MVVQLIRPVLVFAVVLGVCTSVVAQGSPRLERAELALSLPVAAGDSVTVILEFSAPVTVSPDAVRAWSPTRGSLPLTIEPGPSSETHLVRLPDRLLGHRGLVFIDAAGVTDSVGSPLDGELYGSPPVFPSGDGIPGGVAVLEFGALPGDLDASGEVDLDDLTAIGALVGTCAGDSTFDPDADLDSDGCVDGSDFKFAQDWLGRTLWEPPVGPPQRLVEQSPARDATIRGFSFDTVEVSLSMMPVSEVIDASTLSVVQPDGSLRTATAVTAFGRVGRNRLGLRYTFDPPLDQTGYQRFQLSPGLVGPDGQPMEQGPDLVWEVFLDGSPSCIMMTSPAHLETGVAVTRETAFQFDWPLDESLFNPAAFTAMFGGTILSTMVHLSADRTRVTLFYDESLPASALVRVQVIGDYMTDDLGQSVDGDGDGLPGGIRIVDFETLTITTLPGTRVCGRVFASELDGALNVPLQGVTISVDGAADTLFAITDRLGNFCLDPAPVGRFFVHIDGATAINPEIPAGAYYPTVGKPFVSTAAQEVMVGDIYLPLIVDGTLLGVSDTEDTVVEFPPEVLSGRPELEGVQVMVPPGSLFAADGTLGGMVGIAPVDPDRLPGTLPDGLEFPLVITVQTAATDPGGSQPTNFDIPVPVRFPNLPNPVTGELLGPGEKTALFSFDHDRGAWVIMGTMTITADGLYADSDPGVGLLAPGWHGIGPGGGPPPTCPEEGCEPSSIECGGALALGVADCLASFIPFGGAASCGIGFANAALSLYNGCVNGDSVGCVVGGLLSSGGSIASCALRAVPVAGSIISCSGAVFGAVSSCSCLLSPTMGGPPAAALVANGYLIYLGAVSDLYEVMLGSSVWTQVVDLSVGDPRIPADQVVAIVQAAAETIEPGSDGGVVVTAAETTSTLALPRPLGIEASDVQDLLDYLGLSISMWDQGLTTHAAAGQSGFIDKDELLNALELLSATIQTLDDLGQFELDPVEGFLDVYEYYVDELDGGEEQPGYARTFYVLIDETNGVVQRGNLTGGGNLPIASIPPGAFYRVKFFDPVTGYYGSSGFVSGGVGEPNVMPTPILIPVDGLGDTDGDTLPDLIEDVIGTDPLLEDTDGDGIPDGTEIDQGTNPLDGILIATGIISTSDTPGTAVSLDAADDVVVVADSDGGVSVFNVFSGMDPTIVAQIPTSDARAVALSGVTVAVADADDGLHIIDITDPPAAAITQTVSPLELGGTAQAVAMVPGVVYVGTDFGQVVVVDAEHGTILAQVYVGGQVDDLVIVGEWLYVLTKSQLITIPFLELPLTVAGSVASSSIAAGGPSNRRRLFVADGIAYAGHSQGYRTHDVSDPANPTSVTTSDGGTTTQFGWRQLVANGSGLGLAAVGPNTPYDSANNVDVLDLSDPFSPTTTIADRFLFSHSTPGAARGIAIYNGIAYVADHAHGLQVVNYLGQDTLGIPPTVDFTTNITGGQIEAGGGYLVDVTVSDDVEVRNVQLLVDGVVVGTDGNYPFEFHRNAPVITSGTMELSVRATDTGGNTTTTSPVIIDVIPDIVPPAIDYADPADGTSLPSVLLTHLGHVVDFSETVDASTVGPASVTVEWAGPDDVWGTPDDAAVAVTTSVTHFDTRLSTGLAFAPIGLLRLTLHGAQITDLAGNFLDGDGDGNPGGDFEIELTVIDSDFTKAWVPAASGSWQDPTNWTDGTVPGPTDLVLIDRPGDLTITVDGDAICASILSRETLQLNSGDVSVVGTLQVDGHLQLNGSRLTNATILPGVGGTVTIQGIILDGVTLDADATSWSTNTFENGFEINGTLTMVSTSWLNFPGPDPQSIMGTGTITMNPPNIIQPTIGGALTIGSGVTISGSGGYVGATALPLTNHGTIEIYLYLNWLTVRGTPFTNTGTLVATDGTLNIQGEWSNSGLITAAPGESVYLGGTFQSSGIGEVQAAEAEIRLYQCTVDNAGSTLAIDDSTGSWRLDGATIVGGTLSSSESAFFELYDAATFDGVTLNGDLIYPIGSSLFPALTVFNNLEVNGTIEMNYGGWTTSYLTFAGTDDQTLSGDATIVFGTGYCAVSGPSGGATFTVGPGITVIGPTGHIGHNGGTLDMQGTYLQDTWGGTNLKGNPWIVTGTVQVDLGNLLLDNGGTNSGLFHFGPTGTCYSSGGFAQSATGSLSFDIAGSALASYGSVECSTGDATLDGSLELTIDPGYTPSLGASFDILVCAVGTVSGSFSSVTATGLPSGLFFDVQYLPDRVRLVVSD